MKPKSTLRSFLLLAGSSLLALSAASAQSTYTWMNSNVTGTPVSPLDWFSDGPNTQGGWSDGVDPVSSNINSIQIFENTSGSAVLTLGNATNFTGTVRSQMGSCSTTMATPTTSLSSKQIFSTRLTAPTTSF